jgi:CubicO group peptidase (beta-lactamase class C family)
MSVIVATVRSGGETQIREFGALEDDRIAPEEAQVDLGSITKSVTGVAVSELAEQGLVRLDETLSEIFPEAPADKAGITVEQLLTHTGGFTDAVGDDAEVLTRDEYLRRAFASELVEVPGTRYAYSNTGFSILAAIIEERSGKTYDEFLREDVLQPAGLDEVGYGSAYDERRSLRSLDGQAVEEASWGGHDASWHLIGNGGLVATPEAFLRFRQAFAGGALVSAASVDRALTPHVPEDDAGTSFYGYGLVVQDLPGVGHFYWHDGGNGIFSAEWADVPEHGDILFTAGTNSDAGDAFEAMRILRRQLYGAEAA